MIITNDITALPSRTCSVATERRAAHATVSVNFSAANELSQSATPSAARPRGPGTNLAASDSSELSIWVMHGSAAKPVPASPSRHP